MKILLVAINSKYIHSNLAVYSLRANAKEYAGHVEISEFTINNLSENILKAIYTAHPDVLCFSVYIWNLNYVKEISREFHKLCPDIPIWAGGPEVTYNAQEFLLENRQFDGVMLGEGEATFYEMCDYFVNGVRKPNSENSDVDVEGKSGSENSDVDVEGKSGSKNSGVDVEGKPGSKKCEVSRNIDSREKLELIKGIAYRSCEDGDEIIFTGERAVVDMNSLKFAYDMEGKQRLSGDTADNKKLSGDTTENKKLSGDTADNKKLSGDTAENKKLSGDTPENKKRSDDGEEKVKLPDGREDDWSRKIIYYESGRGCPFSCSYCLSSVDKCLRFKSIDKVKQELSFFLEKKVPQVKFVDRTFNCRHDHTCEIWRFLKENDNGITNFHFEISADLINEEELNIMQDMRPGLIQLEVGVQTTNERTIREIRRTMNLERLKCVVLKIQSFGNIHEHLDLIAGLPYEDYNSFKKSFNEIYGLKPDQLQMGFLKVLSGSYMHEKVKDYGIVYKDNPPYEVMSTAWISYDEILKLKGVESVLDTYYNSGQFTMTMKVLECLFDDAFSMYEALTDYYEKMELQEIGLSRIGRCNVLLDFVSELTDDSMIRDIVCQALTFDLYYRENMKTRPEFAKDWSQWKDLTKEYCRSGKLTHIEAFDYDFDIGSRTLERLPTKSEQTQYILFDYTKRNPLNHQAWIETIKGCP